MDLLQKIKVVWARIGLVQRAVLIAVGLTILGAGALLLRWARQPQMQLLYQGLAPDDAAKIVEKISQQNISYQLRSGGTSIYVPKQDVYRLRLDMAKDGLPSGGQGGYKLIESLPVGASPAVLEASLKRVLEEELAKSIQMIEGVSFARVHLDNPQSQFFVPDQEKTTASVVLQLAPGRGLSPANVAAITNLVAGSVSGLRPENVTIVDNHGNLLSGQAQDKLTSVAGTVYDYKMQVEQGLAKKVEGMLQQVLGPNRATVQVSAVIDMNNVSLVTETPTTGAEVKVEESRTQETEPAGQTSKQRVETKTVTENATGKTVRQETILPGQIKSLSVSAVVDLYPEDPNQTKLLMDVQEVEAIIRGALGMKPSDQLMVKNIRFNRPKQNDTLGEPVWLRYMALVRQGSIVLMAISGLLVFRFLVRQQRPATRQAPEALPAGASPSFLVSPSASQAVVKRQLAEAIKNNPEQVRQLFAAWVQEG